MRWPRGALAIVGVLALVGCTRSASSSAEGKANTGAAPLPSKPAGDGARGPAEPSEPPTGAPTNPVIEAPSRLPTGGDAEPSGPPTGGTAALVQDPGESGTGGVPAAETGNTVADAAPPKWRDDPRILALMRGAYDDYDDQDDPPTERTVEVLVDEKGIEVYVVSAAWIESVEDDFADRARSGRLFVVAKTPVETHVVQVVRQHQNGTIRAMKRRAIMPKAERAQWRGAGSPGPDLVLEVWSESAWWTQCDEAFIVRRDGLLCDFEGSAIRCASIPLELDYFNGCGGAESIDFEEGDPPEPCSSISFSAKWTPRPEGLGVTIEDAHELDCLSLSKLRRWDYRWPPPRPGLSYAELLAGPYRLPVTTVPHTSEADPPAPGGSSPLEKNAAESLDAPQSVP